jgi:hypothetical protein
MAALGPETMLPSPVDRDPAGLIWQRGHVNEDVLTGAVFAALSYARAACHGFLVRLAHLNRLKHDTFDSPELVTFDPWPSWTVAGPLRRVFFQMERGRKRRAGVRVEKGSLAPDVILTAGDWRLAVEAEDSKPYNAVQLVQQYVVGRLEDAGGPRQTYHVLVGPTLGRPRRLDADLAAIWRQYDRTLSVPGANLADLRTRLLWIGWSDIEGVLRDALPSASEGERRLLLDIAALLHTKGYWMVHPPRAALEDTLRVAGSTRALVNQFVRAERFPAEVLTQLLQWSDSIQPLIERWKPAEKRGQA